MKVMVVGLLTLFSIGVSAHPSEQPPELWSWFKDLNKSKEACEIQSAFTMKEFELENQKETEYGIYGNVKSNKVVVKCISMSESTSKLMVAVAGHDRDSVALVRNKIIEAIK